MHRLRIVISMLLLLAVWQAVVWTGRVPPNYFPGPAATLQALWQGLAEGVLAKATLLTLARAVLGLLAASAIGIVLALLTSRWQRLRQAFEPVAEFLRPLPPAALVPVSIFFLGLGFKLYAFILIFACLWPVYLNASSALRAVSTVQLRSAASFGYRGWARVLQVQLPAALPEIFIGIRTAASIALIATIVTEMLSGRDGLGFELNDAAMTLRVPDMFAALLLAMLSGLAINGLVLALRSRIVGWHLGMTASNRA